MLNLSTWNPYGSHVYIHPWLIDLSYKNTKIDYQQRAFWCTKLRAQVSGSFSPRSRRSIKGVQASMQAAKGLRRRYQRAQKKPIGQARMMRISNQRTLHSTPEADIFRCLPCRLPMYTSLSASPGGASRSGLFLRWMVVAVDGYTVAQNYS